MPRLVHIAGSFVILLVAYWAYALVCVPLIEPPATAADTHGGQGGQAVRIPPSTAKAKEWAALFPEGAWQRNDPKVLESDQIKLLMEDYQNLGNGRLHVHPCTIIFTPEGSDDPVERNRRSIVLEDPEGATFQFDKSFDLSKLKIGRFLGGQLPGPVTIRSLGKRPDGQDSLLVTTRDVEMSEYDIYTSQTVDFRSGPHFGRGRQLHMHLLARAGGGRGDQPGSNIAGLEYMELNSVERLHLDLSKAKMPASPLAAPQAAAAPGNGPASLSGGPLEIACRGPFRFNLVQQVATFERQVEVLRTRLVGQSDRLTCELLSIFFTQRASHGSPAASAGNRGGSFDLEPQSLEAAGAPAVLSAPVDKVYAVGEKLQYDFQLGRISLGGTRGVSLQQGPNEIHAPNVQYQAAAPGRLGRVAAQGPGWLRGLMAPRPGMAVPAGNNAAAGGSFMEVHWNDQLLVRPHEQNQLISLTGGAEVKFQGINQLKAEQIHFWLLELPEQRSSQSKLQPDRMLALGNVKMSTPQFSAAVKRMEVWFKQLAPPPVGPAANMVGAWGSRPTAPAEMASPQRPAGPAAAIQPAGPEMVMRKEDSPIFADTKIGTVPGTAAQTDLNPPHAQQHLEITGSLLRAHVLMIDQGSQQSSELSELMVEENVHLAETQTALPTEKPLLITGSLLKVTDANRPTSVVHILGQPAHFEGRGMSLTGPDINLDRGVNLLWIDGPGRMDLPVDRDPEGRPLARSQNLQVDWQHAMHFDGSKATFEQSVVASGPGQRLRTNVMEVTLQQPIRFAEAKMGQQPQVEQIFCPSGVLLENNSLDPQQQVISQDRMEVADLGVNMRTGALRAGGPGWLTSVRHGSGALSAMMPGIAAAGGPAASAPGNAPSNELTCVHVRFQGFLDGNIHRRQVTFHDRVRAAYAPVDNWMARLESDDPAVLGPRSVVIHSAELSVYDMAPPNSNSQAMEFMAAGNVVVEGTIFTARAARMSYAQIKDLLILEGDGRTDAELYRQLVPGGKAMRSTAQKIFFWPNTNRAYIDGAHSLEFNQMPGDKGSEVGKGTRIPGMGR